MFCSEIVSTCSYGHTHLSIVPIKFCEFDSAHPPPRQVARTLLNSELASYARQAQQFDWAVYSFSNGHFSSTVQSHSLLFHICLACNPYESGRSLFREFATTAKFFNSGNDFLQHIPASGDTSVLHDYLINLISFSNKRGHHLILETSVIYYCSAPPHSIAIYCCGYHRPGPRWPQHQCVPMRADISTLEGIIKGSFVHQNRQLSCQLLHHYYCSSFILLQRCQANLAQDSPFSDTTTNRVVHLGAFQSDQALAQP